MKSRTTLEIQEGAILQGIEDLDEYLPISIFRFNGTMQKCYSSLITSKGTHNITITGKGTLSGSGVGHSRATTGPQVILFSGCKDILIENITVLNAGRWTIHPLFSTNIIIRGLDIKTYGKNADGIDPDSCTNVLITECNFRTGDDCIAIKSGKNQGGVDIGIPCENITVTKCTMFVGHAAVAIGSEMSGGVKNVLVKDCVVYGDRSYKTEKGLNRAFDIKTRKGRGGYVENIVVSNIQVFNVPRAIFVRMSYRGNKGRDLIPGKAGISKIRNITYKDIMIHGGGMGQVKGAEESPVRGVILKNIISDGSKKLDLKNITGLVLENVKNEDSDKAVKMDNVQLKE